MRVFIITLAFCLLAIPAAANSLSNQALKECLAKNNYNQKNFDSFDFSKAAACHSDYRVGQQREKYAELRDFLKHNPRYRVPGQSLNRCWGKPREMPFESAGIETDGTSMKAWVNYKDKLPAGCYENAPWDNRDVEG